MSRSLPPPPPLPTPAIIKNRPASPLVPVLLLSALLFAVALLSLFIRDLASPNPPPLSIAVPTPSPPAPIANVVVPDTYAVKKFFYPVSPAVRSFLSAPNFQLVISSSAATLSEVFAQNSNSRLNLTQTLMRPYIDAANPWHASLIELTADSLIFVGKSQIYSYSFNSGQVQLLFSDVNLAPVYPHFVLQPGTSKFVSAWAGSKTDSSFRLLFLDPGNQTLDIYSLSYLLPPGAKIANVVAQMSFIAEDRLLVSPQLFPPEASTYLILNPQTGALSYPNQD